MVPEQSISLSAETPPLDHRADLETVLAAWNDATVRLEQTHEALRAEVSRLTDELEAKNRQLARKNRLADLGQIASHVAHEVRNSLVPATLYLSLLRRRVSDDSGAVDIVNKISAGFTAMDAMVNDLLHFTADRAPRPESVPVRELVEEVCAALGPQLSAQGIELQLDVPEAARVLADREMFRRSLLNLAINALDAMTDGGELVVTSYDGDDCFELEVADSGPGLSSEALERACEPFFTTKSHGTGLGLAIVGHIAEAHGGRLTLANCPEGGAAFTLIFPRRALEEAKAA